MSKWQIATSALQHLEHVLGIEGEAVPPAYAGMDPREGNKVAQVVGVKQTGCDDGDGETGPRPEFWAELTLAWDGDEPGSSNEEVIHLPRETELDEVTGVLTVKNERDGWVTATYEVALMLAPAPTVPVQLSHLQLRELMSACVSRTQMTDTSAERVKTFRELEQVLGDAVEHGINTGRFIAPERL